MEYQKEGFLSRRGFCLCCVAGAASAAKGGWLTSREAFAEARGIVSLIKDSAAVSPIVTHKLRNNISVFEGSGGNVAVLTGPDGTFSLAGLPPGKYTLTAWQEHMGTQTADVTITGNETSKVDFVFKATPY